MALWLELIIIKQKEEMDMKFSKRLTSLFLTATLIVGTSFTVLAAANDDVIKALKDAKVPATYIIQAENYLKTKEITTAQADSIKSQIAKVDQIVKDSGVKDLSKLSAADKNKVIEAAKESVKVIDLAVNVQKQSNGSIEIVAKDSSGKVVASFTSNEVKQTGFDSTTIYAGALMIILAAGSVFLLRRNSVKA
jgi:hypothetical protein